MFIQQEFATLQQQQPLDLPAIKAEVDAVLHEIEAAEPYKAIDIMLSMQAAMREMPDDETRALFLDRWVRPFQYGQQGG